MLKKPLTPRRNERCWCNSGLKYKNCCLPIFSRQVMRPQSLPDTFQYTDDGERPVRFVISNETGTGFFSTKDNQIIVFRSRADAAAVAGLAEFSDQSPGEINVAGVGEKKWAHLQATLPFTEVADVDAAVALVRERINHALGQTPEISVDKEESADAS